MCRGYSNHILMPCECVKQCVDQKVARPAWDYICYEDPEQVMDPPLPYTWSHVPKPPWGQSCSWVEACACWNKMSLHIPPIKLSILRRGQAPGQPRPVPIPPQSPDKLSFFKL
jgi:hypothetical protein